MAANRYLKIVKDYEEARRIICDDDIFPMISGKIDILPDDFEFNINDGIYIGLYVDREIKGLAIFHHLYDCWRVHFQVLKEFREKHADDFANEGMNMFWELCDVKKLTAVVPKHFKNVIKFAKKHGFKEFNDVDNDIYLEIERPKTHE